MTGAYRSPRKTVAFSARRCGVDSPPTVGDGRERALYAERRREHVATGGPAVGRGPKLAARRPGSPPLFGYLLDLDDDLAQELELRMRFSARQHATARLLDADAGECDLSPWFAAVGDGPGLLMIDGLLAARHPGRRPHDHRAARRRRPAAAAAALRRRDGRQRLAAGARSRPTRLALLDGEFVERVRSWPQIQRALFRRAERRVADLGVLRAISCQPKLEVRLVLLLWHLAGRWGRVEPTGIRLSLPLTHRLLGQLVAAERPSISHALSRALSRRDRDRAAPGDWHLHGTVEDHLEALIERTARLVRTATSIEAGAERRESA